MKVKESINTKSLLQAIETDNEVVLEKLLVLTAAKLCHKLGVYEIKSEASLNDNYKFDINVTIIPKTN